MPAYEFSIEQWRQMGLTEAVPLEEWVYFPIWGPLCLLFVEGLRERAAQLGPMGAKQPTDLFLFALGEPKQRDVTKVGGLQYRPEGKPWPRSTNTGEPLTFVAQYRFTESRDIIPVAWPTSCSSSWRGAQSPRTRALKPPYFEWGAWIYLFIDDDFTIHPRVESFE